MQENKITVESFLELFNVEYACPCASLIDGTQSFGTDRRFAPSLRGDDVVAASAEFVKKLNGYAKTEIIDLSAFESAVEERLLAFKKVGCVFSDHALDNGFVYYPNDGENEARFQALLHGKISKEDKAKLSSYILLTLGKLYAKHGFVMQLHIGAERYTSSKLREKAGAAGGFAGIGNSVNVRELTAFLDELDGTEYALPKTVLFTLNPSDNALVSVLSGSYAKDGAEGLISQGPAWWWCDHKQGIVEMLKNASVFSVLSNFIGMTTDSRSFLSFVRHDYFRRVLCEWLGKKWEQGEFLCSLDEVKRLARKLCYENAKKSVTV